MPIYKRQQVQKHTSIDNCWIIIQGKVFDLTGFITQHPGGRWIILQLAGKDATQSFLKTIHSPIALEKMAQLYIGDLQK